MKTGKILLGLSRTARNRASGALDDDHERDPAEKQLAGITSSDPPRLVTNRKTDEHRPARFLFYLTSILVTFPSGLISTRHRLTVVTSLTEQGEKKKRLTSQSYSS